MGATVKRRFDRLSMMLQSRNITFRPPFPFPRSLCLHRFLPNTITNSSYHTLLDPATLQFNTVPHTHTRTQFDFEHVVGG